MSPRGDVKQGARRAPAPGPFQTPLPDSSHGPCGCRHSDSLPAAHYHYLSVTAASGGHRKGQGTFIQRISSNISGGKYISPGLNGARRGKWAGS